MLTSCSNAINMFVFCEFAFSLQLGTNRELGFFINFPLYNCKEKLVTSPFLNRTYDLNYFLSFTDEETMDITFALVERVQNLKLSDLEAAVIAPLIVMQSGMYVLLLH